jgi:thioredoxin reductase (NADPH)
MQYDLIIIGGGPAGLSAGLYAARAGLKPLIFAGSPPGGQLMNTSDVENFPTQKSILGPELVASMREQVISFGATIVDKNLISIDLKNYPYTANTAKDQYICRALIVATGAEALWLGLESEHAFKGKGVSACATCDGFFFKNKIVAVVGGGDTALEEAITLTKFASKVYIIHRKGEFKASKIMQDRVFMNNKIEVLWNSSVKEVKGDTVVKSIVIDQDNNTKEIQLNGIFIAIGHKPNTRIFTDYLKTTQTGYLLNYIYAAIHDITALNEFNSHYLTMSNKDGVFVAGDCVDHIYRQASVATGSGVMAALDAERWLINSDSK